MKEEKNFKDSIDPVNIESTIKILDQMANCICKINIKGEYGTGFFCKIPCEKKTWNVLITNYHLINEKDLEKNNKLNLLLMNEKDVLMIELGNEREIYFNKVYDITIIELKEKDNIKDYLELDDDLFQENAEINYKGKSIYSLHFPKGENAYVSYGLLNNIDKYIIFHNCSIDKSSFGSPVLNLQNNKVIGINKKKIINFNFNYNIGTLLKFPLKDFMNKMNQQIIFIYSKEFKKIKELGKGGYGRVNQVLSKLDNKYYAIKEIPIEELVKDRIQNFENEVNIFSKFDCNNIVKYYDSSKDKNNIYILMEFCDGEDLRKFIDKYKNNNMLIEEKIIYNIIKQICIGIKEIHNKKIVHRDLKPENVFINGNMNIKLGDFGISKQLDSYKSLKISLNRAGTYNYIAPEISDKGIFNEKSDIWSLGCIIYELFTLNNYFNDKIIQDIKKIDYDIYNYKWQELIDSLLQKDYNKRFDIYQVTEFLENELKDNINNKISNKYLNKNNKIIGEIYIKKYDINKKIRIINSFENNKRENKRKDERNDWEYENEKEIKENIGIKINRKKIEFTYYHKFNKEGKYIIEYSFKNNLIKTCYLFYDCYRFTNLNLSNFKTQNVTNMRSMFNNCSSLINLDLSNFNTLNVTNMNYMFEYCEKLTNLNLSYFNTQNVTQMSGMFKNCEKLTNLNLSNFNGLNIIDISSMFKNCKELKNLNLSNFNIQTDTKIDGIFSGCYSLKKENIITKDNKIIKKFINN